jgi:hypothetical protein
LEEAGSEAAFLHASAANDEGEEGKPDGSPAPGGNVGFWRLSKSPEAKAKQAETRRFNAELLREDVVFLREQGLVPLAIAAMVNRSVAYVCQMLREAGVELPVYLTTS